MQRVSNPAAMPSRSLSGLMLSKAEVAEGEEGPPLGGGLEQGPNPGYYYKSNNGNCFSRLCSYIKGVLEL